MSTYTGQFGTIKLSAVEVAEIRKFEISIQADTLDDTVMGDSWKTNKAIHKSWSASFDVLYDATNTTGQMAFAIGAALTPIFYPVDDVVAVPGNVSLTGPAIVTERTINSSYDGLVEMTIQVIGNGALVEATI